MLRIAPVMALPALLGELGVDAVDLLAEFDLHPSYFDDPENTLPFTTMGRLLGRCVERAGCDHFGLLVGERAGASALGAVGFLMQSAPTARAALQILGGNVHLHDRGASVEIADHNGFVSLRYAILQPGVEHGEQILAGAIAIAFNILRGLCGPQWRATEVEFSFAPPCNLGPYRAFFGVSPRFDAPHSAVVFPARWLGQRPLSADPLLHSLMAERVQELQTRTGDDLVGQLRRLLRGTITSPDCSQAAVARRLGMHVRRLNRELAAQGTTFARLRDEVRYEAACQLLGSTRTPANEIAAALGYSDASSFTRAFRRWAGLAPARWRASRAGRLNAKA